MKDQNIPPFGACFSENKDGIDIKINDATDLMPYADENGKPALKVDCCITCSYGGTIAFMDSGQEVY